MPDQATLLRDLVEQRLEPHRTAQSTALASNGSGPRRSRVITVTSGKGGVGKSCLALNIAVAMSQSGQRVCLLDANLGLGNIDLMCGLNGYWNLAHVMNGSRTMSEIILPGPAGIRVVPGASGLQELADCPLQTQREFLAQLESLEEAHDILIVDTGSGIHRSVRQFLAAADSVLIVTTPEPTSIADAYATIKTLCALPEIPEPMVVVNQVDSLEQGREILSRIQQTSRTFLHRDITSGGLVPRDQSVPQSIVRRTPFVMTNPESPASRAVEQLARRIIHTVLPRQAGSFFQRLRLAAGS